MAKDSASNRSSLTFGSIGSTTPEQDLYYLQEWVHLKNLVESLGTKTVGEQFDWVLNVHDNGQQCFVHLRTIRYAALAVEDAVGVPIVEKGSKWWITLKAGEIRDDAVREKDAQELLKLLDQNE